MNAIRIPIAGERWPAPTGSHSGSWWPHLLKWFERLAARLAVARRVRRDVATVVALDDRMLRDIGLMRLDVERRTHYGRW